MRRSEEAADSVAGFSLCQAGLPAVDDCVTGLTFGAGDSGLHCRAARAGVKALELGRDTIHLRVGPTALTTIAIVDSHDRASFACQEVGHLPLARPESAGALVHYPGANLLDRAAGQRLLPFGPFRRWQRLLDLPRLAARSGSIAGSLLSAYLRRCLRWPARPGIRITAGSGWVTCRKPAKARGQILARRKARCVRPVVTRWQVRGHRSLSPSRALAVPGIILNIAKGVSSRGDNEQIAARNGPRTRTPAVPRIKIRWGTAGAMRPVRLRYAGVVVNGFVCWLASSPWPALSPWPEMPRPKTNFSYGVDGSVVVPS